MHQDNCNYVEGSWNIKAMYNLTGTEIAQIQISNKPFSFGYNLIKQHKLKKEAEVNANIV